MKPFSMESVLRYRTQLEKLAQQELFTVLKQETETKQQAEQLANELNSLHTKLASEQQQGLTVENLIITENWISNRQESLKKIEIQLESLSGQVTQSRKKLIATSRDKKALDKLKKKQNTAFEIAVLRYKR
jgi:flagellar export protein FliJ